jgi:hypothetical protein
LGIRAFFGFGGLDRKGSESGTGIRDQKTTAAWVLGGKVLAVWAVRTVPGSFAALRMTAGTNNGNGKRQRQRRGGWAANGAVGEPVVCCRKRCQFMRGRACA